jgi:hypothetical protein
VMTGKDRNDSGQILRRLTDDIFQSDKMFDRQLSNRGGYPTKLISFQNAIELVMVIPGTMAKQTRTQFAQIIRNHLSMHNMDEKNINEFSYSSIDEECPNDIAILKTLKRKRSLLELLKFEEDIKSQTIDNNMKELTRITKIAAEYDQICRSTALDEKARVVFKEIYLNLLTNLPSCIQNPQQVTEPEETMFPLAALPISKAESPVFNPDPKETPIETTPYAALKSSMDKKALQERKKAGFSLRDIIQELDLDLDPVYIPAICKSVCTRFKNLRPESKIFSRMRRTFFFQQDRGCIEKILREEYLKHRAGREFEIRTA